MCWSSSSSLRARQGRDLPPLLQPLEGKSSPGLWLQKASGLQKRSSETLKPCSLRLGLLRHLGCSYRKGFIDGYEIYSSCIGDNPGGGGWWFLL